MIAEDDSSPPIPKATAYMSKPEYSTYLTENTNSIPSATMTQPCSHNAQQPEKTTDDDTYLDDDTTESDWDLAFCRYLCNERMYPRTTVIPIMVNDMEFLTMFDSGATLSTISRRLATILEAQGKGKLVESHERIRVFEGYAQLTQYMILNIGTRQEQIPVKCWVTKDVTFDLALGTDFMEAAVVDDLQSRKCVRMFNRYETLHMTNVQIHEKRREYDDWFRNQDFRLPCQTVSQL